MKKILFVLLFAISGSTSFAQVEKGRWMMGGNIFFESSKFENADEDSRETIVQLNPNIGYFLISQVAVGVRGNLASRLIKRYENGYTSYLAGPFVRGYLLPAGKMVNLFGDASIGFGRETTEFGLNGFSDEKEGFNQFTVTAGPALFLNKHTALEVGLKYTSTGGDFYEGTYRLNSFGFNMGFQIHLGGGSGK